MDCPEIFSERATPARSLKPCAYAVAVSALGLLTLLLACAGDSPTGARPTPITLLGSVTGRAADAIGSDGQIQLAPPPSRRRRA